jgi:hypothetical protein
MLDNWDAAFPNCEPIAHLLREQFKERWVRFHSLPESKRYPENEDEMWEVLQRHNTILGELLGGERKVMLLTTGYSETAESAPRYPELAALDPNGVLWRVVPMHQIEGTEDRYHWHVSSSLWDWQPAAFDPLVRLVAEDKIADVMMVHPECRWMLHPYDGGMDVILESSAARGRLKSLHREWLSARADGM